MKIHYFMSNGATFENETFVTPRPSDFKLDQKGVKLYESVHFTTKLGSSSGKSKKGQEIDVLYAVFALP